MDNEDSKQLFCLHCLLSYSMQTQTCQISNFDLDSQLYALQSGATSAFLRLLSNLPGTELGADILFDEGLAAQQQLPR